MDHELNHKRRNVLRFSLLGALFAIFWYCLPNRSGTEALVAKVLVGVFMAGLLGCCALLAWQLPIHIAFRWLAIAYLLALITVWPWFLMGDDRHPLSRTFVTWGYLIGSAALFITTAEMLTRALVRLFYQGRNAHA